MLLDGATFDRLAAGVAERCVAMERILADLYGPRTLVADGVVPGEALSSTTRYRIGSVGLSPPRRWLTTYAVDVVQLGDGTWRVVRDLADAPTGIGYALLDRAAMLPVEVPGLEEGIASLSGVAALLRHALAANTAVASPRLVVLSGGVEHAGYVEDSQLARILGFTLIERPDVVVRQGRLWLRTLGGLDPIDVVYRRVDDDETDPIELAAQGGSGVPGILSAVADGGVVLANAHGCGVIEDAGLARFWPAAAEALTGSSLQLPQLGEAARTTQPKVFPSFRAGELVEAAVVLRLHAVAGPDGVTVVPGGNGRVLEPGDDPLRPSARTVKDVWVLDAARSLPAGRDPAAAGRSRRFGSDARRRGAVLDGSRRRASRGDRPHVAGGRRSSPPGPAARDCRQRQVVVRASSTLRAVARSVTADESPDRPRGPVLELDAAMVSASHQLGAQLRSFVAEAASVGEFLPSGISRVLTDVAALIESFSAGPATVDTIDDVLASLAAFAGMWNESTVRGPAWRFGDIGLRVERGAGRARARDGAALAVADGVDTGECGAVWRCCSPPTRALSPIAASIAATSPWPRRSSCCCAISDNPRGLVTRWNGSPSMSLMSVGTRGRRRSGGSPVS